MDKLYRVTDISMSDMSIKAVECENDSPAAVEEVFSYYTIQQTRKPQYYGFFRVEKTA